jgi:uncharacterized membrane protein
MSSGYSLSVAAGDESVTKQSRRTLDPTLLVSILIVAAMFALSLWAWMQLPAGVQIPVHWGPSGEPDRYGGKFMGLMLMPAIAAGLVVLFEIIPRVEPRRENILRSRQAYNAVRVGLLLFLLGMHVVAVMAALGIALNMSRFVGVGMGLFMIVIGGYLGKVRSNYMFGIRTPWTLASDLSWEKTHRLGGRLFILSGLLIILSGILAPTWSVWVLLITILGSTLVVMVYSYQVWKHDPDAREPRERRANDEGPRTNDQ